MWLLEYLQITMVSFAMLCTWMGHWYSDHVTVPNIPMRKMGDKTWESANKSISRPSYHVLHSVGSECSRGVVV